MLATVTGAHAQCAFPHPAKAKKIQMSLVGAFLGCANAEDHYGDPNAVTVNGLPACAPAKPYYELTGVYAGSWRWDPARGKGLVQLKARTSAPVPPLYPPGNPTDVAGGLEAKGVLDAYVGWPATGDGSFGVYGIATERDRMNGDLTTEYFLNATVPVARGSGKVKTTVDALLNAASPTNQPGLPHCANVALVGATVNDPNGDWFATGGLLLR